jgi:opacity protein-like surface antigen
MGRAKALWFLWSLAGAMQIAATAHAAEVSQLPPAPELEDLELRGSLTEESGFSMRVDAGVAYSNASGLRTTYGDGSPLASPVSLGDAAIVGIGAGYQFNAWVRADITGEYRPSLNYNVRPAYGVGDSTGTAKSGLFLANAYVDFGNWLGFTPYVGAGVGAALWQTSAIRDNSLFPGATRGFANAASGANLAWDLTAGVAYHLLPNLLIDVSYRYVNMGSFKTGALVCGSLPDCHFGSQSLNVASNDLRVGLRWLANEPPASPVVNDRY